MPPAKPTARVTALVRAALQELPSVYADRLENVDFVVARRASRYELQRAGIRYGSLYGLYEGVPLPHRGSGYSMVTPDKITVFWEPLVRDFPDDGALADQVRRTVYHEIAHHFGISDAALRRSAVE